jgi:ABC-type lipoprotein export system ATPase subunit
MEILQYGQAGFRALENADHPNAIAILPPKSHTQPYRIWLGNLDRDYSKMPSDETTRFRGRNIGFVFQAWNLIPTLTAVENVAVPLIILGTRRHTAIRQASEILLKVGLDDRMMQSLPLDLCF